MSTVTLLGPQRLNPTVDRAVRDRGVRGRIATITAGWQEREPEDQELDAHLQGRTFNLSLYRRAEEILKADPELDSLHRERQDRLRALQSFYRIRLSHALEAARELVRLPDGVLEEQQLEAAIRAIRNLDAEHLSFVDEVNAEYARRIDLDERPVVQRKRRQVMDLLESEAAEAVAIAGGHVAVLLNRLRLFDIRGLLGTRHLFAWSAGAMVTGTRIVLFHDSPPQGGGNAEVLESGIGLHSGVIPLPHATERLVLDDRQRVALFARRFAPDLCLALDQGDRVDWTGQAWEARSGALQLATSGALRNVGGEELTETMMAARRSAMARRAPAPALTAIGGVSAGPVPAATTGATMAPEAAPDTTPPAPSSPSKPQPSTQPPPTPRPSTSPTARRPAHPGTKRSPGRTGGVRKPASKDDKRKDFEL